MCHFFVGAVWNAGHRAESYPCRGTENGDIFCSLQLENAVFFLNDEEDVRVFISAGVRYILLLIINLQQQKSAT